MLNRSNIIYYVATSIATVLMLSGIFCICSSLFFALNEETITHAYFLSLLGFFLTMFSFMSAMYADDLKGR